MIRVKDEDGVSLDRLDPELWAMVPAIAECYARHGVAEFWITSGSERTTQHAGKPVAGDDEDPHYAGKALDGRIQNCPRLARPALVEALAIVLQANVYHESPDGALTYTGPVFVLRWEYRDTPREHVHVQKGHVGPEAALA